LKFWDGHLYPDAATLTCAKVADSKELEKLVVEDPHIMHVFDRGYIDYKRFDEYCKHGIRFTSRLKDSAIVTIISENPIIPGGVIRRDCIVKLGDGKTQMQHELRLIEVLDTQGNLLSILTNDLKASAEEIGQIYRYRWQIKLFFKWIKQHFSVKHFYATSPNAVENQIYIALIAYCLLQLLKLETGCSKSLLHMTRVLTECIYESYDEFVQKLHFKSSRTSRSESDQSQSLSI
jgi:IS4 transposase